MYIIMYTINYQLIGNDKTYVIIYTTLHFELKIFIYVYNWPEGVRRVPGIRILNTGLDYHL